MSEHTLEGTLIHHDWDASREPVLSIASGDVVHFDLQMAGERQVEETSRIEDVVWDFDTIYNLAGPIFRRGSAAGSHARGRDPPAGGGSVGLDGVHPRRGTASRRLSRSVPQDLRPAGALDRDRGPGCRGPDRPVSRHDGRPAGRARIVESVSAAQGRREHGLPPSRHRLSAASPAT